jgi:hypothetical protein
MPEWAKGNTMKYELYLLDINGVSNTAGDLLPGVGQWLESRPGQIRLFMFEPKVGLRNWMEMKKFGNPMGLPTEHLTMKRYNKVAHALGVDPLSAPLVSFVYHSDKTNEYAPAPVGKGNSLAWSIGHALPGGRLFEEAIKGTFNRKYPDPYNLHTLIVSNDPEVLKGACRAFVPFTWADCFFPGREQRPAAEVAEWEAKRREQEKALGMGV